MIIRVSVLLLALTCVKTDYYNDEYSAYAENYDQSSLKIREREAVAPHLINDNKNDTNIKKDATETVKPDNIINSIGPSEGGDVKSPLGAATSPPLQSGVPSGQAEVNSTITKSDTTKVDNKLDTQSVQNITSNSTANALKSNETIATTVKQNATAVSTSSDMSSALQSPGVVKRGLIVFGGFALLAVAYFVFYRRKGKKYDTNNSNTNDTNQFRYGVLQSEDRRDNLELSRIPLTMESDEDDEEDLEIFDLEQKRKSLSYVNLQTNDEDVVLHSSKDESKNNLLLDIEDGPSDTLINWSNTGSNSIL
ncbi:uncharacterized protein LOC112054140 [Bicyclus anynana]|uniref:Uncharacterized protein LOC112054140 n=1 Tax=Bicyclus anynana TaxID=110368 RepID=A0A6J1P0T8_BICAN|nr:uncharacterized protein LOC112054140 [Bicyclus anynana]